jgi:hypothetical protein
MSRDLERATNRSIYEKPDKWKLPFQILTVLSSPEETISPVGRAAIE